MATEAGNFINNYKILSKVAESHLSSTYLVELTSTHHTPVLLTIWHKITFTTSDDAEIFLQKAKHGVIFRNSQRIPLLDAQLYHQSPYIVTPFNELLSLSLSIHMTFIDHVIANRKMLHPDNPHSSIDAFLYIFCTTPNTNPFVRTRTTTPRKRTTHIAPRIKLSLKLWNLQPLGKRTYIVASIALLLLLLIGATAFLNFLPANAATVTIVPLSKRITNTYPISLATGVPGANQIQAHTISYTTPPQSQTVPATGTEHHDATNAQGQVFISQIHLFNLSANNISASPGQIQASDGTLITVDTFTATEGGSATVNAHASTPGQNGNIPAQDIAGLYDIYPQNQTATKNIPVGIAVIQNPNAFTGGQDAKTSTYVQQQDIDGAANPLITQLTPAAQQQTQQQLQTGEILVKDLTCSSSINADHLAQDTADFVTVTVQATCSGIAYSQQDLHTAAANAQKADALAQYGASYQLSGDITTGTPTLSPSSQNGAIVYKVPTDGVWVFQIDKTQQQELARTIAGHGQQDATNQILKHKGIKRVLITLTSNIGTLLPASPDHIKFTIVHIPGLASS